MSHGLGMKLLVTCGLGMRRLVICGLGMRRLVTCGLRWNKATGDVWFGNEDTDNFTARR